MAQSCARRQGRGAWGHTEGFLQEEEHWRAEGENIPYRGVRVRAQGPATLLPRHCRSHRQGEAAAPRRSHSRTTSLAAHGCRAPDTLPGSTWPNLKFTGSASHLARSCEKHSTTFTQSGRFISHTTRSFQGQRDLPLHSPLGTRMGQACAHTCGKHRYLWPHSVGPARPSCVYTCLGVRASRVCALRSHVHPRPSVSVGWAVHTCAVWVCTYMSVCTPVCA